MALVSTIAVNGCASFRSRGVAALGSPGAAGLAILEVALDPDWTLDPATNDLLTSLQHGSLRLPGPHSITNATLNRQGSPRSTREGLAFAGFLVFRNLEPGEYTLRSLGHPRYLVEQLRSWSVYCERREFLFPDDRSIRFTIRPGELQYLGRIDMTAGYRAVADPDRFVMELSSDGQLMCRLQRDRQGETRAWETLLSNAPASPWAGAIEERIEQLREAPLAGTGALSAPYADTP